MHPTLVFDAAGLSEPARTQQLTEIVRTRLPTMDVHVAVAEHATLFWETRAFGNLIVSDIRIDGITGFLRRDQLPSPFGEVVRLNLVDTGEVGLRIEGRDHLARAGAIGLTDGDAAMIVRFGGEPVHMWSIVIPVSEVKVWAGRGPNRPPAVVDADHPWVAALGANLRSVFAHLEPEPPAFGDYASDATIMLVRGFLASLLSETASPRDVDAVELASRIRNYIDRHLDDPDLTAQRIADAHHISRRYVYVILERHEIRLGEYMRRRRIERAAEELRRTDGSTTIASIAVRAGFSDQAHFGRAFRAHTGLTPSAWRREARTKALRTSAIGTAPQGKTPPIPPR
ncbi:helix-turn-helix domain-containing protein [Microbacterium sp.]|uniref:helix-turn-helix domain-containing protein n=1 Tax=Microbacterium sp. TaxID=51671 RepID=UPI003C743B4B